MTEVNDEAFSELSTLHHDDAMDFIDKYVATSSWFLCLSEFFPI